MKYPDSKGKILRLGQEKAKLIKNNEPIMDAIGKVTAVIGAFFRCLFYGF